MGLKDMVENEHDKKLRRIETDLRWTMMLVGAQFITIIGSYRDGARGYWLARAIVRSVERGFRPTAWRVHAGRRRR